MLLLFSFPLNKTQQNKYGLKKIIIIRVDYQFFGFTHSFLILHIPFFFCNHTHTQTYNYKCYILFKLRGLKFRGYPAKHILLLSPWSAARNEKMYKKYIQFYTYICRYVWMYVCI